MFSPLIRSCSCAGRRNGCRGLLESLLTYETNKKVLIKDPMIGAIQWLALIVAFLYFFIWRIFLHQAYFAREPIISIVETSLRAPASLAVEASLSYCQGGPGGAARVLPCATGPAAWVAAPSRGYGELFVATRLKYQQSGAESHRFVQNPEDYIIDLAFIIQAAQLHHSTGEAKYSRRLEDLQTKLVNAAGTPYKDVVTREGRSDTFTLAALLEAAGLVGLDDAHGQNRSQTFRYSGLVLQLSIDCETLWSGGVDACSYKVRKASSTEARAHIVHDGASGQAISRQERHGVRILVSSTGYMGRFDISEVLISLASTFALLEVVAIVLNWLISHLLPYRDVYRMLMYDESFSFQELREGSRKAERALCAITAAKLELTGESPSLAVVPEADPDETIDAKGSSRQHALAEVRQRVQRVEVKAMEAQRRATAAEAAVQPAQFVAQQALNTAHAALAGSRPSSPSSSAGGPLSFSTSNPDILGLQGVTERCHQQVARTEERVLSLQAQVDDAGKTAKSAQELLQREDALNRRLEARIAYLERALGIAV